MCLCVRETETTILQGEVDDIREPKQWGRRLDEKRHERGEPRRNRTNLNSDALVSVRDSAPSRQIANVVIRPMVEVQGMHTVGESLTKRNRE